LRLNASSPINLPNSFSLAPGAQRPHEAGELILIHGTRTGPTGLAILQPDFSVYGADEHLQPPRPYDSVHPVFAVVEHGLNAHVLRTG
jgi:hypothetical protein